ncbi:endonuclease domain-containing 1 protein-like [Colossoma macropomum]|uniref:endonuclease domain-containing 1 protein-like n=1 Tax=Colossoma macropomum TaxID=42526 RepID=UPI0018655131|nr:endonuclease domain-containing 1 protein-like [Colossoma macropomum]
MKLLAAVLMLLTLGALGDVVDDFTKHCSQFFLDGKPPRMFPDNNAVSDDNKQICQKYNKEYHYATLYDSKRKIPVYSAYEFKRTEDCKVPRPKMDFRTDSQLGKVQAFDSDYSKSGYTRGHLFPVCHTDSEDAAKSTCILTNTAPQEENFNGIYWAKVEDDVRKTLWKDCLNKGRRAYVVTGVVPSREKDLETLKNEGKVNVPTHFWNAYACCKTDVNNNCDNNKHEFGGYIMHKDAKTPEKYGEQNTFEDELTNLYNIDCKFKVFADANSQQPAPSSSGQQSWLKKWCTFL